ncbi:uncharacterized protein LOC127650096 [Xyrauchen texanus]|uniref:uncharacterized protein LOC127650096 n=1 Tax=Xyrauchen texanus TaxID=154827 RepID=UPI002241FD32|nr:uncharacterized protein LOC127650096 [Xyrauchen texanus]
MPGPANKSGCQKRKEKKKRELARALDPNKIRLTNFFQSAQKPVSAPSQANDSQEAISERATTNCVYVNVDLTLVEERDLVKYLKLIQSRKLMKGIKEGLVTLNMELVSVPDPSAPSSPTPWSPNTTFQPPNQLLPSPPSTAPSTSSASQPGVPWHVDFRLNWDQVSSAIRLRVEKEERPLPDERKAFVVVLVDQMMQHDRNPTRAMCHSVVRNIVRSNPKSFGDIGKHGDTAGDGCHSLLQQVKTRVENKNRNNTLAQRHRERRPCTGMAGEARLARGPVDQYGGVRWGPADWPEGETEATLENMKRDLLNIYSEEGMTGAERAEPMMEKTYVILRKYLKVPAAAMSEIKQEWTFLFSQKCLFSHFGLLTDVDVLQKLQEAISRRGQTILDYCATLDDPKIRDVLACYDPDSDKAACILLLLMLYFKEPKDFDPCATAVDVNTAELPSTPCLIIQGDMMKPSGWLISIEGHVVMGPHPFFLHRVAAFFSSYYVFNLEYPAAGSSTLEFIQRCFLGINPERGSKTKKWTTMNPHVSTLLRKLIDFEWAS